MGSPSRSGSLPASVRQPSCSDGLLIVEIADDGVGAADPSRGSGLRGLADRVEALGGTVRIESPPSSGTRLEAVIPLDGERVS